MRERSARKGVLPVAPRALILGEGAKVSGTGKDPHDGRSPGSTTDDAQRCCAPIAIRLHLELDQLTPLCPSKSHSTGTSTGASLSLIKNTRNFAGLVLLAFRSTT